MLRKAAFVMAMLLVGVSLAGETSAQGRSESAPTGTVLSLAKKAEIFQHDMQARFLLNGQALCKLKLPTEKQAAATYNMPDNAYMTGIYLGTLAMQYAVTKDPQVREHAAQSIKALDLLCTVSGKPGLLARAAVPVDAPFSDDGVWRVSDVDNRYRWRGDVSSDQMDGVIFGFAMAFDLAANEEEKKNIAKNVAALVDHLLDHDLRIVDYDGTPTTWGKYYPSYVTMREPMNALLLLQHLKVAHHVTGEERFGQKYRSMAVDNRYAEIAVKARRLADPTIRGAVNHSDDVLLFLAYYPLLRLEKDVELRNLYLKSYRRMWEGADGRPGVKPEDNPLYAFTAHAFLNDASSDAAAIRMLQWMPFDIKWNRTTIAQYEQRFGFMFDPAPKSPEPKPQGPVPLDRRLKTWSVWVQDPYHEAGDRNRDELIEYNGHDFLLAYWLGRYHGYIAEAI